MAPLRVAYEEMRQNMAVFQNEYGIDIKHIFNGV